MLPLLLPDPNQAQTAAREGAPFGIRAVARVIDTAIHIAVGLFAGLFVGVLLVIGGALRGQPTDEALERLSVNTPFGYLAALLGMTAMHCLAEGFHGSTIGKRICGLTVLSEDGTPASLGGALKRSVAFFWDSLFFGLVAAQKMSESPRRQRYGDTWGGTQVVRLSSLDAAARRSWARFGLAVTAGIVLDGLLVFLELACRLV